MVVPSFGLQVTTVMGCGQMVWYKKLVLLLDALLAARHPHRPLRPSIQRTTQTVRHVRIHALRQTRAPMVDAAASGATAERARHTAEIVVKVVTAWRVHPRPRSLSQPHP